MSASRRKLQFYLHPEDAEKLEELVHTLHLTSLAELLRSALSLYRMVVRERQRGKRLMLMDENNVLEGLLLPELEALVADDSSRR